MRNVELYWLANFPDYLNNSMQAALCPIVAARSPPRGIDVLLIDEVNSRFLRYVILAYG